MGWSPKIPKKRNGNKQQQSKLHANLQHDYLLQTGMKKSNHQHESATEHELQPAGVRDLPRHLVGHQNYTDGIYARVNGKQGQQRLSPLESRSKDHSHDWI